MGPLEGGETTHQMDRFGWQWEWRPAEHGSFTLPTHRRLLGTGQRVRAIVAYVTILILTLTTFIFGGFMREQVCASNIAPGRASKALCSMSKVWW